jgi:hypothetical protein
MRGWQQEELLSSISVAQPHPRTLEESFLVGLFVLEDDLYPLQGHYPSSAVLHFLLMCQVYDVSQPAVKEFSPTGC